jgi:cytochrome c-type biogenesis protein CcmF
MADFGALTVLISLVLATYAGAASLVGASRTNLRLLESGRAAVYALAAVLGLASIAMVQAFVAGDYSIKYVQHYSDDQAPMAYKIAAYWGGLDGCWRSSRPSPCTPTGTVSARFCPTPSPSSRW